MKTLAIWLPCLVAIALNAPLTQPTKADDNGNTLAPAQMLQVITPTMKTQIFQAFQEGTADQLVIALAEQTILTPNEAAFTMQMLEFEWKKQAEIDARADKVLSEMDEAPRRDVITMVANRQNAAAMALMQAATGLTKEEAHPLIASIERQLAAAGQLAEETPSTKDDPLASLDPATRSRILQLLADGEKISAIKELRAATGLGLKDSKDIIDAIAAGN